MNTLLKTKLLFKTNISGAIEVEWRSGERMQSGSAVSGEL